jgi:ligand-binding sensor domain-containing protein
VSDIQRTPEGLLWMATLGGGVARWDGEHIRNYGSDEGLDDPLVLTIIDDRQGELLAGTVEGGLYRVKGERFTRLVPPKAPETTRLFALRRDDHGRIWAGTADGLWVDPGNGKFSRVGLPDLMVNDVHPGTDTMWVASAKGLYYALERSGTWVLEKHLALGNIHCNSITRDSAGNIWIGTNGHGLYRSVGSRVDSIGRDRGLESLIVEFVVLDAYENLWVGTRRSLHQVELDVMQERILNIHHFGPREGFEGIQAFRNACLLDTDSTLWFGSVIGATNYDPRRVLNAASSTCLRGASARA